MVDEAVEEVVVEALLDALDDSVVLTWSEQPVAMFTTGSIRVVVRFDPRPEDEWEISFTVADCGTCSTTQVVSAAVQIYSGVLRSVEQFLSDHKVTGVWMADDQQELKLIIEAYLRRKGVRLSRR